MIILQGKGVSVGVSFGVLSFLDNTEEVIEERHVKDVEAEVTRFESARALAATQLATLAVEMEKKLGKENSLLFEIHQMMLDDLDYRESVSGLIQSEKVSAEYAVSKTAAEFAKMFAAMEDEYMRERGADVQDVSRRVIQILTGKVRDQGFVGDIPVILASDDFAPSQTAQLDKEKVMALATSAGSSVSHTAIFARTMGMPAVIGLGEALKPEYSGKQVALDGETGQVFIEPDAETIQRLTQKQQRQKDTRRLLEVFRGKPTVSADGRKIHLFANIGSTDDLDIVLENDAEGIGLFRSEFLYLESNTYPSEETQFAAYKKVAEKMAGRMVIIRTLDIGADKQAAYFNLPKEENPALGMRAIRICLTRPEVFKTQLRALYRASAFGKVAIMFPMITSVDEVKKAKAFAKEVRDELANEGVKFDADVQIGIMIETPAAAIISDLLAKEADFFSIGTNDLTQYTIAIDRQNESLDQFYDAHHEAVLRLIRTVVENAHKEGKLVGICGELGADQSLTATFMEMGIDELSVTPSSILPLRKLVSEIGK